MSEDLEASILEELQCPVCDHYMHPPICQCQNGHSICQECFCKVKNCPKCRAPKSNTARSYTLEAIHAKLRVPCKYAHCGCDFVSLGQDIVKHQTYCKFTPKYCPFKYYDNCPWRDVTSKLKGHLTKKHNSNFYIKEKQRFMSENFKRIADYHYIYAIVFAYKEFFRVTWDVNNITGMTRWAVYFMGSPEEAKKFSYKIEFPKPGCDYYNSSQSLIWKSPCEALPEKENIKFVDNHCLHVYRDVLFDYCEAAGHLNYRVTIYIKDQYHEIKEEIYSGDISS